jgi:hypothetical protein
MYDGKDEALSKNNNVSSWWGAVMLQKFNKPNFCLRNKCVSYEDTMGKLLTSFH